MAQVVGDQFRERGQVQFFAGHLHPAGARQGEQAVDESFHAIRGLEDFLEEGLSLFVQRRTAFIVERVGESFEDAQRAAQIVAGRRSERHEFLVRGGNFLLVFGHVFDRREHRGIALARRHELQACDEIAAVGTAHRDGAYCSDLARRPQ